MRGGFTLVEVIVAVTLLAVGVLALAGTAGLSAGLLTAARREEAAALAASALLDSLVHLPVVGGGAVVRDGVRLEWSAAGDAITVSASWLEPRGSHTHTWYARSHAALDALRLRPELLP